MLKLIEDPHANHVREMATHFDAALDEGNDASTISMDNDKAKGFISSYRIFKGLSVWVYNLKFLSDFKVDLNQSEDSPYYFCYNVEGHFLHRFGNQEDFTKILQNQNMIVKGSAETNVQIVFPANIELKIAVIIVDLKLLGTQEIRNAKRIYSNVGEIFKQITQQDQYRYIGSIETNTAKYASIVCENNDVDLVGGLQTEGAVLNMLASQIQTYNHAIAGNQSALKDSELSQLTSLGPYVIDNIETSFTILELSKHFGMSPKKLQIGIKHLYGNSVAHYILNLRIGYAKHLLVTTDLNVSQVCHLIGISSRSYFAKVFKNRYGVLPSHFLK